jgi:hypothetical protein
MFDLPSDKDRHAEYAAAGKEAFATLLNIIVECQQSGALGEGDSQKVSFIMWSMVHGVAKLAISRQLPFGNADLLEFTDTVSRILSSGLESSRSAD